VPEEQRGEEMAMSTNPATGIVRRKSKHLFDETAALLKQALQQRGVALFAVIDHSGEAAKVGLVMPPTQLFIFGNPRAGTPVMIAAPSSALDLPLKILISQDEQGVWLDYDSPAYLQTRHGIPAALIGNLAAVDAIAASLGE
jgi:uncharacterized protein (DUF302 family)